MSEEDLLNPTTFYQLWKHKDQNKKFCEFLAYLQIDINQTEFIQDEKYVILWDSKEEEYILFSSKKHPIELDFLEYQKKLKIKKQRIIILK